MFETLTNKFSKALDSLRGRGRISTKDLSEVCEEIRLALLEADVALAVTNEFVETIRREISDDLEEINKRINPAQSCYAIIEEELEKLLGGSTRRVRFAKKPPTIIMLVGLQGSGKTTLAGKLAKFYKDQGHTPLLVAADLQRPNAVTQLQQVAETVGVPVFAPEPGNGVGNPIKVAQAGVVQAQQKLHDLLIVDTAGRLGVDEELMQQAQSIKSAIAPHEVLFVVDAMMGQDAVRTAQAFLSAVDFDGVVLTKLDGDARGGAALSIVHSTQRPIMFASSGEKMADFDIFHPDRMASRILGLGDIATLGEQAKSAIDEATSKKLEAKFVAGEDFTLDDFLAQMEGIKKMGSFSKIMGMMPGMNSGQMKKAMESFDEGELVRTQAIIQSMTPQERANPKILNGSRRARIAKGSGRAVSEINSLVERFTQAQKMMRQVRGGAMPAGLAGLPAGMGGFGGAGGLPARGPSKNPPAKKKSRSGNPAKRAAESG